MKRVKKCRASRVTESQIEEMVLYMEEHPLFASGKFLTKEGRIDYGRQWELLAARLNTISNGAQKNHKQWETVWRAAAIRNARHATGNQSIKMPLLSPLEVRIVGIIGLNYVEGSSEVPGSTPEEEPFQRLLETGDESALMGTPQIISLANDINFPGLETTLFMPFCDVNVEQKTLAIGSLEKPQPAVIPTLSASSRKTPYTRKSRTVKGRKRIGIQLENARSHFAEIGETQAAAMLMFAESSQKLADAAALSAANEERRLAVFEKLTIVLERLIDKL